MKWDYSTYYNSCTWVNVLRTYNTAMFAKVKPLEARPNAGLFRECRYSSYCTLSLYDPSRALSSSVTLCLSHYIPSVKENPYELDSKTAVLLMELNIHLRGFKMLKAWCVSLNISLKAQKWGCHRNSKLAAGSIFLNVWLKMIWWEGFDTEWPTFLANKTWEHCHTVLIFMFFFFFL